MDIAHWYGLPLPLPLDVGGSRSVVIGSFVFWAFLRAPLLVDCRTVQLSARIRG
jgi:hypothetical protein